MENSRQKSGGIKEMIWIAFPMVVSHACDTTMIFTDRMFLSKLGSLRMNAAMGGGMASFVMMAFFLGLTGYSTALVAQYLGAKEKAKCSLVNSQSLLLAFLAFPLILFLKPFMVKLIENSSIAPEQIIYQVSYFNIIVYSTLLSLMRSSFSGFFCGIGKTRIVMTASFASMFVNIFMNYVLIFGRWGFPSLGIKGAAIGTLIGGFVGVLILFVTYLRQPYSREFNTLKNFTFNLHIMKKLLRYGTPAGIELFINFSAFSLMVYLFHAEGAVQATAATIMFNWDMVSFVPLLGIEIGVTSLVGRYMGARKPELAHQSTMSGFKLACMYSFIIFILFLFLPETLVTLFRPSEVSNIYLEAVPSAVFMIRVACLYVFVEALVVTFIGALRGAGDTMWSMSFSVGLHLILVMIEYFCLRYFHLSVSHTWLVIATSFLFGSFFLYRRYRLGHWKEIEVIHTKADVSKLDGFHEG